MTEVSREDQPRSLHSGAVLQLARELNVPDREIASLYEAELQRLMSSARVTAFVPVLVGKRVRRMVRNTRGRAVA